MLEDIKLPTEFWDSTLNAGSYIRNRVTTKGPIINNEPTSPIEAFTDKKADVDYIRVWGCQCVAYINLKSLPAGSRHDKLVPRG